MTLRALFSCLLFAGVGRCTLIESEHCLVLHLLSQLPTSEPLIVAQHHVARLAEQEQLAASDVPPSCSNVKRSPAFLITLVKGTWLRPAIRRTMGGPDELCKRLRISRDLV